MDMLKSILASDALANVLLAFLAAAASATVHWLRQRRAETDAEKAALAALEAGVTFAHETIALAIKRSRPDGRLTTEERQKLREAALSKAVEVASGPAAKMLASWARPKIDSLIADVVARRKHPGE